MKIAHPFLMKFASFITILVLCLTMPGSSFVAYAEGDDVPPPAESAPVEQAPVQESSAPADTSTTADATGGTGGDGGSGGSGDTAGDGGTGGDAGGATSDATGGDGSATGGDGGSGGTGGDSTGGGTTGEGGDGGTGGTGGDATQTADGGTSDATGGTGGDGGTGGGAQAGGDAGDGGNAGTGGDAAADSTTDDGSDAAADASGGNGGNGGEGGDGTGAQADGGTGGDAGNGGSTDATADAQNGGDAAADATGGDGGSGGGGGDGGTAGNQGGGGAYLDPNPTPADGQTTSIETGDATAGSTADMTANTTNTEAPLGSEEGDDETEIEIGNVLGATTTASSTAETGLNVVADADGSFIRSGVARSFAYLISLFNIAITNSTGSILFLKNPIGEALNLTGKFMEIFGEYAFNSACSLVGCELDDAVLSIYTDSVAEVTNEAVTRSYTGGNVAVSPDGLSDIESGDASAFSGIVNIGNLSIYDSRYLLILIANEGDLSGDILLPDGAFFDQLSTGAHIGARSDIEASSTADILNTADANAATGDNSSYGLDGSEVASGNADATASSVNFVNHLGAPICFIVNHGGEWRGDVINIPDRFSRERTPFGDVICGAGGAERDPVTGLELEAVNYAKILNTAIADAVTGDNVAAGLMARIATGDAEAFAQILNLVNMTIIGQDWIFANFAISGDWDGDLVFGVKPGEEDVLGELIEEHVLGGGSSGPGMQSQGVVGGYEPNIIFTKEASVTQAQSPAVVDYTITVHNAGGEARQVVVNDTMKGPNGSTIGKQMWNLGKVKHNEEVKIKYTIEFKGDVTPGYYTNIAVLTGQKNMAIGLDTMTASDVVEVLPPGEVAAAKACEPLLTEYIKPWRINNRTQVLALQGFLNAYEGEDLTESGVYDPASQAAVKEFQVKYADDILAPWGITKPTGNVYYTTQKKVNEIVCADLDFSLTPEQLAEIESFKASTEEEKQQTIQKGNTGSIVPKNLLELPSPTVPVFFKTDASKGEPASTSAFAPFKALTSWLVFAPLVEALEL